MAGPGPISVIEDMVASFEDFVPPYEGKDPNLVEHWYCKTCLVPEDEEGVDLLVCSRCRAVRYCSVSCQQRDFNKHRYVCREINRLTVALREQAVPLRSSTEHFFMGGEPENLFDNFPGRFWTILGTRDYCRTRHELSSQLISLARWYEVRPLLEMALEHQLELLRLICLDNMGLRFLVPFTLLSLNRDDDCYGFIKHWMQVLVKDFDASSLHGSSFAGDWIYPTGVSKHDDIVEALDMKAEDLPLAFIAALCIIKLRIIAAHEEKEKQLKTLEETSLGRTLEDSFEHVVNMHINRDGEMGLIAKQKQHLDCYLRAMQKVNPTLLPAIVNPGPLKGQPRPRFIQLGHASEAWGVLGSCGRHIARIPRALAFLEKIVGKDPSYDCDVSTES